MSLKDKIQNFGIGSKVGNAGAKVIKEVEDYFKRKNSEVRNGVQKQYNKIKEESKNPKKPNKFGF